MNNILVLLKIIKVHMHLFFYLDVPNDFLLVFSSIKYEEETVTTKIRKKKPSGVRELEGK